MANWKKLAQGAAGAAGGAGLNVEEVFSTYLYTGNNTTNTITNEIDLSTEGGLVWLKNRDTSAAHWWIDTERGSNKHLYSNQTSAEETNSLQGSGYGFQSFNTDGFTLGTNYENENKNNSDLASWTFRKAPKFFDVVTYTGNGTAGRTISHNLGSVPGMIIVKRTDSSDDWTIYHRGLPTDDYIRLTSAAKQTGGAKYRFGNNTNAIAPTSTEFTVATYSVNETGGTYVAYIFAHNDGDGEFGSTGDQDIIKCGSYTGNASTDGPEIDLGWEPQWLLVKAASDTGGWGLLDNMRGFGVEQNELLSANTSGAENSASNIFRITPTGFKLVSSGSGYNSPSGTNYIYMAIRRGPMAVPESSTDVFDVTQGVSSIPAFDTGFTVDLALQAANITSSIAWRIRNRLTDANYLRPDDTAAEVSSTSGTYRFDLQTGYGQATNLTNVYAWLWRRAPNFFDVVAYRGNGTSGNNVPHNLNAVPEMIWVKRRDSSTQWYVYHVGMGNTKTLNLNDGRGELNGPWNNTTPTSSVFTLSNASYVNGNGDPFVAYLFGSLDGISKCGSYTGNGGTQRAIDCGFSNGASLIIIKRRDTDGDWYVWDSERGISTGNDPFIKINKTNGQVTTDDSVEPSSSGFLINQNSTTNINVSSATYIFYAVAA